MNTKQDWNGYESDVSTVPTVSNVLDMENGYLQFPLTPREDTTNNTQKKSSRRFVVTNVHARECMAEFFGTFIMALFGMGVNNMVTVSEEKNGTWLSVNICWGVAVMLGVHCAFGVSGGNLNPAVTFTNAVFGKIPWWKVPGYVISQTVACFLGAAMVYLLYHPKLIALDPEKDIMQSNFATYPADDVSNALAFYTEALATAMLIVGLYSILDEKNRPAEAGTAAIHFALLVAAIGMAFGMNTGYAMNPARDFGPRLFTLFAGYGSKVFTIRDYYFWIPLVAPPCGGCVGGFLYHIFVERHHDS